MNIGDRVEVLKYGGWYAAEVLHITPNRVKVRFTTKGGRVNELFVPKGDVRFWATVPDPDGLFGVRSVRRFGDE